MRVTETDMSKLGGWARLGIVLSIGWCLVVGSIVFAEYREVSSEREHGLSLPPPPTGFALEPQADPFFFGWQSADLVSAGAYVPDFELRTSRFLSVLIAPIAVIWILGGSIGWIRQGFNLANK